MRPSLASHPSRAGQRCAHHHSSIPCTPLQHTPQGSDYALRYHDLHANRYVRYFRGHTGRVTTLAMSPKSDTFLSAAEDKQARAVAGAAGAAWGH